MVSICPTVTADNSDDYQRQVCTAADLSLRIHIDASDGQFAPRKLLDLNEVWWPAGISADVHLMYVDPIAQLDSVIALQPRLVIAHAEATGDFKVFSNRLRAHGIEVGVALLPETAAKVIIGSLDYIDHVLIFSGNLGYQGGSKADVKLLDKVTELKTAKKQLEIGWDGGVNDTNISQLVNGGIEVLNVGGYLQGKNPQAAYATLASASS